MREIELATVVSEAGCGCTFRKWYGDKRVFCMRHGWVDAHPTDDMPDDIEAYRNKLAEEMP